MFDRITTVMTSIVTAVTAVAIVTHPTTRRTVSALGGAFTGALRQIVRAGGR